MSILILGILLFLGVHSVPMFPQFETGLRARLGARDFRVAFSLLAGLGLLLLIWGFHRYSQDDWMQIWTPPIWMRHITITLMWFAFVSMAAMGPKPSRIKGWLRHPMVTAIKIWALAHLLVNGDLGGMLVFGAFLLWAGADRMSLKRRGDVGAARQDHFTRSDAIILVAGSIAYVVMMALHPWLIGVSVFG